MDSTHLLQKTGQRTTVEAVRQNPENAAVRKEAEQNNPAENKQKEK